MMAFRYIFALLISQIIFGVTWVSAEEEPKVVCYYINWSQTYQPQDVEPYLCTHIIYAFAVLDSETLTITPGTPNVDVTNGLYERVISLRIQNPKLRVLLALGGWADSIFSERYSRMVGNDTNRENFVNHTMRFLDTYGFDGLDLDWEFPVCWRQNCSKGPTSDKENFSKLTRELRTAFDQHNPPLMLTAAISAVKPVIDESYDIEELNRWLHFINVMLYDLNSDTNGNRTVHHAAMYRPDESLKDYLNVNFTMNYLLEKGASREKLILGIPTYGKWFNLLNEEENQLGAPTANSYVGFLAFNEICQKIKRNEWTAVRHRQAGPYAYGGSVWIGYDDPLSAAEKGQYVRDNGFGGVMTWELTMDDHKNVCCGVRYPLIKSMKYGLLGNGTSPQDMGCS